MTGSAARLWRAEAMLRRDRPRALGELEGVFADGRAPERLDGPMDGRLVTGTLGYGLNALLEGASRLWMPWTGKVFDPEMQEGRNRFVASARTLFRVLWPRELDPSRDPMGAFTAFRFDTSVGASVIVPGLEVLRIDYDHPASPWPVRLILDELVEVGDGQHLGQALLRWRGRYRRVAWFALEGTPQRNRYTVETPTRR